MTTKIGLWNKYPDILPENEKAYLIYSINYQVPIYDIARFLPDNKFVTKRFVSLTNHMIYRDNLFYMELPDKPIVDDDDCIMDIWRFEEQSENEHKIGDVVWWFNITSNTDSIGLDDIELWRGEVLGIDGYLCKILDYKLHEKEVELSRIYNSKKCALKMLGSLIKYFEESNI